MGKKSTVANASQDFVDLLDKEADDLGLSRTQYTLQRINAGRLLFDGGKLDVQLLNELMETDGSERVEKRWMET
jgi:hypothetical protein